MSMLNSKKIHIKTYGCQMNVYDTERMADVMAPHGYRTIDTPEGADLVILNTCHIREKAEDKVYSDLGRVRAEKDRLAKEGKRMILAVGGCVGQAQGAEIMARAPYVDMVFGPQTYHRLPEMLARVERGERSVVDVDFPVVEKFDTLPRQNTHESPSAFLSVQEGCDKFCTFCVVPYTRGAEYSRKAADVIEEAKALVQQGVMEITLLGQNVNAYHGAGMDGADWSLARLMKELAKIDGLERIRYTTSHPRDMSDDLIAIHGEEKKVMPYLHLPVQAGSDAVLKRMNRHHTAASYVEIIEKLRAVRPDIAISGDFIVGFPGETEEDFCATMALVETVGYSSAYSFKYSIRPGTPAGEATDQVPEEDKTRRLALLQGLLGRQQFAFNRSTVGMEMDVLFDRVGKYEGQILGKSPYLQSVHLLGHPELAGKIARVKIVEARESSLKAELV